MSEPARHDAPAPDGTSRSAPIGPDAESKERATAYAITWIAYATYYLGRKGFSVTKARIAGDLSLNAGALARIDTAFLGAYAVGQFIAGPLADSIGARRLVGIGMLCSAAACAAFGLGHSADALLLAFAINGLAQATGWPGTNKAMAEWTRPASRGAVMGIWATCYQVGGIAATALATWLLVHYGWRAAFRVPALLLAIVSGLVLTRLRPGPNAATPAAAAAANGAVGPDGHRPDDAARAVLRRREQRRVLASPSVWSYGASYFCIKLIRYTLLFWLPYYLHVVLGWSEGRAGYLSTAFEIGGVVGAITLGALSDRANAWSRPALAALSLVGLSLAMLLYGTAGGTSVVANVVILLAVGALLFGPDALISGAAAQDAGGPYAAATAVGIVNGIGSVGGLLQGAVTVGVRNAVGWQALFYVLSGFALLAAFCLTPAFRARGRESAGATFSA